MGKEGSTNNSNVEIINHKNTVRKIWRKTAYFSMEIGINEKFPIYSGGLGVLSGDTIKSCADLKVPLIAVSLINKKGYFSQVLDMDGNQKEFPENWNPADYFELLPDKVTVKIEGREVLVQAWQYEVRGISGFSVPILFLDTDIEDNEVIDRDLTCYLYGGDEKYRLKQEAILGIGGIRMLKKLGHSRVWRYHMNEGHSSLLTVELMNERKKENGDAWNVDDVRRMCVFTTHTPVPAGHDQFSYDIVESVLGDLIPIDVLRELGGSDKLNMTHLALNSSHYVNGVAKKHRKISREMFPGYHIDSITNGVHTITWTCESFKNLYNKYIPGWQNDPFSLRYALNIPDEEISEAHNTAKRNLIDYVNSETDAGLEYDTLTIGFARRVTAYKRINLVFRDTDRLVDIAKKAGKIQFIFAGKAHFKDQTGKALIKEIVSVSRKLKDSIKIVFLQNYDMGIAKKLVSGVDLWLNTPQKPLEASGTSGMKAAHNGVPSLSILDGWWIEGCIENYTGWAIGSMLESEGVDVENAASLYDKLEKDIIPTYYENKKKWLDIMAHSIALNASFFNTHRMVQQYVLSAYSY